MTFLRPMGPGFWYADLFFECLAPFKAPELQLFKKGTCLTKTWPFFTTYGAWILIRRFFVFDFLAPFKAPEWQLFKTVTFYLKQLHVLRPMGPGFCYTDFVFDFLAPFKAPEWQLFKKVIFLRPRVPGFWYADFLFSTFWHLLKTQNVNYLKKSLFI